MYRGDDAGRFSVQVALVFERIHAREHGDQQIIVAAVLIARLASRKLEALRPLPMLKHRSRRAMLDRGRRRVAPAEGANRVRDQKGLAVSCGGSHGVIFRWPV